MMKAMRARVIGMMLAGWLGACHSPAQPPQAMARPADGDTSPVDYAKDAAWICRPGVDRGRPGEASGTCSANLDAVAVDVAGKRTPTPYVAAKDPKVDCFYVYPTVSADKTLYADMDVGPEELRAVHGQLARLGSVCRLFAPAYHQFTMTALGWTVASAGKGGPALDFNVPYRDVLAAWREYMKRDNKGRGVVLIGHSQGAMILKRLIAEEIDGKPAQKRLVAAYLAGNTGLTDKSFKAIPPCARAEQTGCVVAWSSYRDGYLGQRFFGGGAGALCVNPAAPAGGRAPTDGFFSKPRGARADEPPYVEAVGGLSAECVRDDKGAVLAIRVEPGAMAERLEAIFGATGQAGPTWGLHPLDVSVVQGNVVAMIGRQAAAWGK